MLTKLYTPTENFLPNLAFSHNSPTNPEKTKYHYFSALGHTLKIYHVAKLTMLCYFLPFYTRHGLFNIPFIFSPGTENKIKLVVHQPIHLVTSNLKAHSIRTLNRVTISSVSSRGYPYIRVPISLDSARLLAQRV